MEQPRENSSPAVQREGDSSRYEILRVVNRGGMGEIALARVRGTKGFEKLVVLKRLRADAEREDHQQMFDIEGELMSRIEHPNIVQVFDQPTIGRVQYLAMAYIQGRNLDQLIRKNRQENKGSDLALSLSVISEVLRGLAFVHRLKDEKGHALGVVHQDITPSNILVSFWGEVKITDFGIAYVTSRDGGRRRGVLKGKPRYVAPEVLAGKRVNNKADIYGVAVVLFEMLTLRPLFARATPEETLAAVARNEVPDLQQTLPQVGEGVHALLYRALAKEPNERYRTAEEMHADVSVELARLGGQLSSSRLGYTLRQRFIGAPDVPDIDPGLDEPLAGRAPVMPPSFRAPNLDQTLTELDRLLGGDSSSSHDLLALPADVRKDLDQLQDNDPFAALTPIPDLALSGPNGEELLMKAIMKSPTSLDVADRASADLGVFPRAMSTGPKLTPISDGRGLPSFPDPPPRNTTTKQALSREVTGGRRLRSGHTGEYTFTPSRKGRSDEDSDRPAPRSAPEAGGPIPTFAGVSEAEPLPVLEPVESDPRVRSATPSVPRTAVDDARAGNAGLDRNRSPLGTPTPASALPASAKDEDIAAIERAYQENLSGQVVQDELLSLDRDIASVRPDRFWRGFVMGSAVGIALGAMAVQFFLR